MTFVKKILLVDYTPRVVTHVRRALEDTGRYIIKEEIDSRQAVNVARWFHPDLILFDINPSSTRGNAIARELQADPELADTPVVFLGVNASNTDGAIVSGGILSGYSFLANPLRIEDFVRYVGELLRVPAELLASGYRAAG